VSYNHAYYSGSHESNIGDDECLTMAEKNAKGINLVYLQRDRCT
jgi:hypothetical protein